MLETALPLLQVGPKLDASLVFAYDAPVLQGAYRMEHPDPPFTAWLIRNGNVTILPSNRAHERLQASRNDWLLLPPLPRSYEMTPGTHLLSIRFHLGQPGGLPVFSESRPILLRGGRAMEVAGRKLARSVASLAEANPNRNYFAHDERELSPADALIDGLRWRGAFLEWLQVWMSTVLQTPEPWQLRVPPRVGSPIDQALDILNTASLQLPLRLSDLARESGVSESHLKRLFAKEGGLSPSVLWNQRKWTEACRLLRQSQLPLKLIAYDLGFRSPAHFTTWFKSRSGRPPQLYRRSAGVDA